LKAALLRLLLGGRSSEVLRPRCFTIAAAFMPWMRKVGRQPDDVPANALASFANKAEDITCRLLDL
jgi:hypothetical protein